MRTSVKVIADSVYAGHRLTTFELEYPLYIHAEFMTHRAFSRNAQSNRAIPVDRLVDRVKENRWYPIWVENQPGMAASKLITDQDKIDTLCNEWDYAKDKACEFAKLFANELGVHKQIANRILSPYQTIKVICSATELNNFFRLRIHPAAQQEIQELAVMMRDAMKASKPAPLDITAWHVPYITIEEIYQFSLEDLIKLSTARCARVSYLNHDGVRDPEKDFQLHDMLLREKHMSPFEHCATPWPMGGREGGNFRGFKQYRWYVENDQSIL